MAYGLRQAINDPGIGSILLIALTLTAGTVFLMWLGEQITAKGIGNGISLIIFSGIVAGIPGGILKSAQLISAGDMSLFAAIVILALMGLVD